jgi:hypothetical protein
MVEGRKNEWAKFDASGDRRDDSLGSGDFCFPRRILHVWPKVATRRALRFRLRSLLVVIAFLGLILTVILQAVGLKRAAVREELLQAQLQRVRAESNLQKALAAVDQMHTMIAQQMASTDTRAIELRRELLERALIYYQSMESNASSPEARTNAIERVRQIRSKLGGQNGRG